MDIKKFISSDRFNTDHNDLIQDEANAVKNRTNKNFLNNQKYLHKVSECDFFTPCINVVDMFNDPNILEFQQMIKSNIDVQTKLAYSGSMIKRYFDPNLRLKKDKSEGINNFFIEITGSDEIEIDVENCYVVTVIDPSPSFSVKSIFSSDIKKNVESKQGFYVIQLNSGALMCVDKKSYPSLTQSILSNNEYIDRMALYDSDLWVSSMFVIDMHKRMTYYNKYNRDPVFGYPEDIMNIYDRTPKITDTVKKTIDIVDFDSLQSLEKDKIEETIIVYNNEKYTVIEYLIVKMMDNTIHPMIQYHMSNMIIYLHQFLFFRPPFFVASMCGFDKVYPSLYETVRSMKQTVRIDPNIILPNLEMLFQVDMFIIRHLIKSDNDDVFVEYITKTGLVRKLKQESKTTEKIVNWLTEFAPRKIIGTLIDCMILPDKFKYKLIFLTQDFNLLGKDFLSRYVLKKAPSVNKNHKKKVQKKETEPEHDSEDTQDTQEEHDTQEEQEIEPEQETKQKITDDYHELPKKDRRLIIDLLPEIINRGLTRGFYMILKLCPFIIDLDYNAYDTDEYLSDDKEQTDDETKSSKHKHDDMKKTGSLLHMVNDDKALDILEIIIKRNPELMNIRDEEGRSALVKVAELGLKKSVLKLLDHGAEYDLTDNKSETFLHKLCKSGDVHTVQNIIRLVLPIIDNKNDQQKTPIMISAENGHEELFYILKGLNADLKTEDVHGNTAYHYVCLSKICLGLIIVNSKNRYGLTPYEYCKLSPKYYHFTN